MSQCGMHQQRPQVHNVAQAGPYLQWRKIKTAGRFASGNSACDLDSTQRRSGWFHPETACCALPCHTTSAGCAGWWEASSREDWVCGAEQCAFPRNGRPPAGISTQPQKLEACSTPHGHSTALQVYSLSSKPPCFVTNPGPAVAAQPCSTARPFLCAAWCQFVEVEELCRWGLVPRGLRLGRPADLPAPSQTLPRRACCRPSRTLCRCRAGASRRIQCAPPPPPPPAMPMQAAAAAAACARRTTPARKQCQRRLTWTPPTC